MTESPFRASASVSASGRASRRGPFRTIFMLAAALVVAGCASGEPVEPGGIADPYESTNRGIHEFNKGLDTVLLRPASQLYDIAMPGLGDLLLTNAVNFLRMPMNFINHTAQGEFEQAGADVLRTGINLVMGLGVLDPATEFGLPQVETDIGETLYVWGVAEGPYVEIPVFGPASARDGFGRVAEIVLDPFGFFTGYEGIQLGRRALAVGNLARLRAENTNVIDQTLYESEDSYVTTRAGYIQYRRRQLAGGATEESLTDVFAD